MNIITKKPVTELGYNFIASEYLPRNKDEYYLRYQQNPRTDYRPLKTAEIKLLEQAGNTADNWKKVLITPGCNISLIRNCKFYGHVRIGKLEPLLVEFNNLQMAVGLYNSTIISSDIGDNVAIDNVNFISHYIISNEVMLANIHELACTDHSKYGNGILKEGEKESVRIWLEICNENAGRSVMPFDGMLAADAWLWSKYRADEELLDRFKTFTEKKFDNKRGYYGEIGERTVIKNCSIIKDVKIGTDAYIKGANKLKNLTINSTADARSQIGEGCELVNGIIGVGCRAFYGVKAVRFIMAPYSQLKYGARLINSYLGENSTISCCEVLNSLIFPAHEQHHNNSFLCASVLMGQSNMAAGATIGSNHNSRGADGELIAGRGFWPGLCVSLKHNSKFASFTLIAKGDFPAELNIPIPFSLVSNDVTNNRLVVMPAYWFMYNMYALARNESKYLSRDKRKEKIQHLEYDFLAPDSVNEVFDALRLFRLFTGQAFYRQAKKKVTEEQSIRKGEELLSAGTDKINALTILAEGFENTSRPVELIKVQESYNIFKRILVYYGIAQLINRIDQQQLVEFTQIKKALFTANAREPWINAGGQLIASSALKKAIKNSKTGKINSWDELHTFYSDQGNLYEEQKQQHAFAALVEVSGLEEKKFTTATFRSLLDQAAETRKWMVENITASRAKDYASPFRKMVYETQQELEKVIGKLKDNSFINQQKEEQVLFLQKIKSLRKQFT